jgi:mRNA interferase MazF
MARGDIVYAELPTLSQSGHEQMGRRPALIVHDDATSTTLPVIMIIPFTGSQKALSYAHTILVQPTQQNGLATPSVLLIFQLRAIDRKRLRDKIGELETAIVKDVDAQLRRMLNL